MSFEEETVIFNLTREDYLYKGILFAEADNRQMDKEMNNPFVTPKDYVVGVMAIIWVDEKSIWHSKMRLKFPSGNKQVVSANYEKENEEGITVNETLVLQELYRFPMINKTWLPNPDGTPEGIVKLIQDIDMIENIKVVKR